MNDKLAKYEHHPKNPKKLKLKAVLHKLRDYRLLFENDSDAFNEALSARIRSIRKMPTDYFICLDVWSMGLIRYAEKQGMIVDRDKYIETDLSSIGL